MTENRTRALANGLVTTVLALTMWSPVNAGDEITVQPDNDPRAILQERLKVLEEVVELQRTAYRRGEGSFDAVLESVRSTLEARLELAESRDRRIVVREAMLKNAGEVEAMVRAHVEAAQATRADLLRATALRLRAEADLLLERREQE